MRRLQKIYVITRTRPLPQCSADPAVSPGMTAKLTQFDIAKLITDAVKASLQQAITHGCTAADVPAIAKAIGGNAAMAVWVEAVERGVQGSDDE